MKKNYQTPEIKVYSVTPSSIICASLTDEPGEPDLSKEYQELEW